MVNGRILKAILKVNLRISWFFSPSTVKMNFWISPLIYWRNLQGLFMQSMDKFQDFFSCGLLKNFWIFFHNWLAFFFYTIDRQISQCFPATKCRNLQFISAINEHSFFPDDQKKKLIVLTFLKNLLKLFSELRLAASQHIWALKKITINMIGKLSFCTHLLCCFRVHTITTYFSSICRLHVIFYIRSIFENNSHQVKLYKLIKISQEHISLVNKIYNLTTCSAENQIYY